LLSEVSPLFVEGSSNDAAISLAADRLGVAYISLREPICHNGACQTRVGPDLTVSDRLHFTPSGSAYVMRKIAPALMSAAALQGSHRQKTGSMCRFGPGFYDLLASLLSDLLLKA
jgi:hypothetical protein